MPRLQLITLDIPGTVLDWRTGLEVSCHAAGRSLRDDEFDRIVDVQEELERGEFLDHATVTQRSLVKVPGLDERAAGIGVEVGRWPLHPDSSVLRSLMRIAPCAAMTNSDRRHGANIQARPGLHLRRL